MKDDKFDVEVKAGIKFKQSPDFNAKIEHKAIAGVSEKDLIERHTIGQLEEDEEEQETTEDAEV